MSALKHRAVADESSAVFSDDSSTAFSSGLGTTSTTDLGTTVPEEQLLSVKGNDYGFPLLIKYEQPGTILRNMPNMLLENKGPVARDHLANERNYLAWARTSLSFTTVGLAVTAAFRGYGDGLLIVGKLVGAGFILLAIALMVIGTYRYYITAIWLQRGKFPPSRASIFLITVFSVLLIALAFILIVINTSRVI
ncbi:hypothetical protein BZA70DRAFT_283184 [Myxozyma melibiosi]|uniref:DUF202 domain-containing protein n=1 Tax=Myxozyma melibiosi TaxID=54550 RepID=A0ABR1F1H8_9ASCO